MQHRNQGFPKTGVTGIDTGFFGNAQSVECRHITAETLFRVFRTVEADLITKAEPIVFGLFHGVFVDDVHLGIVNPDAESGDRMKIREHFFDFRFTQVEI